MVTLLAYPKKARLLLGCKLKMITLTRHSCFTSIVSSNKFTFGRFLNYSWNNYDSFWQWRRHWKNVFSSQFIGQSRGLIGLSAAKKLRERGTNNRLFLQKTLVLGFYCSIYRFLKNLVAEQSWFCLKKSSFVCNDTKITYSSSCHMVFVLIIRLPPETASTFGFDVFQTFMLLQSRV